MSHRQSSPREQFDVAGVDPPILTPTIFMKRLALYVGLFAFMAATFFGNHHVSATSTFNKQWKEVYLGDDVDADFKKSARKAGCYVCHVKGEDKKKVRNEYGEAVHKYLDAHDFEKEYVRENKEKAAEQITEGLKKAAEEKSSDGRTFGEKLEANELPATNAGL